MIMINKRGSNLIYIVILMTILGILVAGYASISIYSSRSVADARQYQQDYVTAHSLREVFVQMAVQNYPDSIGASAKSGMDNFVGAAVTHYTDYLAKLEAYEESQRAPKQILWQTDSNPTVEPPIFENYKKTITASAELPEGLLTHTHTINLVSDRAGKPECWMIIEIDFRTFDSEGKIRKEYHLGARLEPNPDFSRNNPTINKWNVVKYYETD